MLQIDIDAISQWCADNELDLDARKLLVITFPRKTLPVSSDYDIGAAIVKGVLVVRDLGVMLDEKPNFNIHVCTILLSPFS